MKVSENNFLLKERESAVAPMGLILWKYCFFGAFRGFLFDRTAWEWQEMEWEWDWLPLKMLLSKNIYNTSLVFLFMEPTAVFIAYQWSYFTAFNRRYADDAVLLLQVSDSQRQDCKPSVGYQAAKYVFLMLFSDWILELLMCRMIYTWKLLFSSISWRGEVSRCSRSRESGSQISSSSLNKTGLTT